jgi:hypothetical protein
MTTPVKQYQNVSYAELLAYAAHNPNRNRTLDSIEIINTKQTQDTSLDKLGLKGYSSHNLNPTGILSLLTCIADPSYYSLATTAVKTQKIIDICTKLQEKTDNLKNTVLARKRKKIHDLIGAVYNGSHLDDKENMELIAGVAFLSDIQFVLFKSAVQAEIEEGSKPVTMPSESALKGEVVFSSDPATWKRDLPIWVADYRAQWVAIPMEDSAESLHTIIGTWLGEVEQNGWVVQWPEVDGTKTELIEVLSSMPGWNAANKSLRKETLAARLGKINAMKNFAKWLVASGGCGERLSD